MHVESLCVRIRSYGPQKVALSMATNEADNGPLLFAVSMYVIHATLPQPSLPDAWYNCKKDTIAYLMYNR